MPTLYSGTSGFAYPSWKPEFYPEKLASKKFLSYYATRLNAVEVNYTFRRLPSASTLENWVNDTRPGFVFPLKAHMRLTHILRLKPSDFTEAFFRAIDPLRTARRLGPVLFQLPPALKCDEALLADFLVTLPPDIRFAFEFRHASWLTDGVYGLLEKHGVALCLAESEKLTIPKIITSSFVYSRLRMPEYSADDRTEIAVRVRELLESGRDVYVFFKHEETPAGALYAEELLRAFPAQTAASS
jgi:uncharacterized protein YecE (DUF72 family)